MLPLPSSWSWSARLLAIVALCAPLAHAQTAEVLRPQVATPLQAVQALLSAGKARDALVTLRDVESKISDRSLYETYIIERLKAAAAVALNEDAAAVAALDLALKTGKATVEERRTVLAQLAGLSLKLKEQDAAARWAAAHLEAGGQDEAVRVILVRVSLAKGDCKTVVDQLAVVLPAAERRGETPPEPQLRASAACHAKLGDDAGYYRDLERLVRHHPRKEYWADIVARLQRLPEFADRLMLDSLRLMKHVGAMEDADDFMGAAQLALRAALPAQAVDFLKAGFDAGVLGKGASAQAQRDLLARAQREADADKAQWAEARRQAEAGRDARQLLLVGLAAWSHGQADVAVPMVQKAIEQGLTREPDDARLHLALVLASAGRREEARHLLGNLPARDGLAAVGRLWAIALR